MFLMTFQEGVSKRLVLSLQNKVTVGLSHQNSCHAGYNLSRFTSVAFINLDLSRVRKAGSH